MADLSNVRCPTCHRRGDWFANPYGPFCSQRCKLVDLGQWFEEEHRLSEPLKPAHFEEYASLPPGRYLDQPEGEDR